MLMWLFALQMIFYFVVMAKQIGNIKITGTIDNVCYYKMYEEHYARLKSSLNAERVKSDPAFAGTMRQSELMKLTSPLGKQIYQTLPVHLKKGRLCQNLAVMLRRLLKEGKTIEERYATVLAFAENLVKQEQLNSS